MKKKKLSTILALSSVMTLGLGVMVSCNKKGQDPDTTITSKDIVISNAPASMVVSQTITLIATANGETLTGVTWASSNPGVLTVDSASGFAMAHSVGSTTVTATKDGYTTATIEISVTDPTLSDMVLSLEQDQLYVGGVTTITAKSTSGFTLSGVSFATSNANVVVVGQTNGIVRAMGVGTATITATLEGYNPATIQVTVIEGEAPAQQYLINFADVTGVSFECEKTSAEEGETVVFTATPTQEDISILSVTMNGEVLTSTGNNSYSFVMPATDVNISATITIANADVYVDGELAFPLVETSTPGLYHATQTIDTEVSLNFHQVDKDTNEVLGFSIQDIDTYKSFAKIENPIDYNNYQFTLPGGFTYDFYFDVNAEKPIYIRRNKVNTLPSSVTTFENLFDSGSQRLSVFPQDVKTVSYQNTVDNVKYDFTRYSGNKSYAKITDLNGNDPRLVYKSLDGDKLTIVDNYLENDFDQTARGDNTEFSLKVQVEDTEAETSLIPYKNLEETEGWGSNGNEGWVTYKDEAIFQANYYSHNYNSLEFEFMDAYRVGYSSEDDYLQSYTIQISSTPTTSGGFKTVVNSSRTLVDSGNSVYEHYEYDMEITFDATGRILEGTYLQQVFGTDAYDFTDGDEGFKNNGENLGTTVNSFTFAYTYGDLEEAKTGDLPDVTPYFIQTIDSVRINNDEENTDPSKNVLRRTDDISQDEGTLEIQYSPSTALDVAQYDVVSSSNTSVIGQSNVYYIYEAKSEGTSDLVIGNRVTNDPSYKITVEVGNSVKFHSVWFNHYYRDNTCIPNYDLTSNEVMVYDNSSSKVYMAVTPDEASNRNLTLTVEEQYQSLVDLSYDPDTFMLTIDVKGSVPTETEVTFTVTSPDMDPDIISTIRLTIIIVPSLTTTLSDLVGTWSPSPTQDDLLGSTVGHKLTFTEDTTTIDGETWYLATITDGSTSRQFAYRLNEDNELEGKALDTYDMEAVRIQYDSATGEVGLVYELAGSWEGQDSGTSSYLIGSDDGDEDYLTYIYEWFVKD